MSHAAKLSELGRDLITSVTGKTSEDAVFKQCHDRTTKGLRNTTHARTNQFDVQSRLDGLVEKFSVLNRDDLAEGLQTRLDALPTKSKWLPEILALLLTLSDRPLDKTRIEDVEAASQAAVEIPALTWEDILADDPLDEPDIWDDVERGHHSSDDDFVADEDGSVDQTQATSITEDDPIILARMHVLQIDNETLRPVKDAHEIATTDDHDGNWSELALIREALLMLHGLPTNAFNIEDQTGRVAVRPHIKVETSSRVTLDHALQELASIGTATNVARIWTRREQAVPAIRSCQAALAHELQGLATQLSEIEQRYIFPCLGAVASITELRSDVEQITRPIGALSRLMSEDGGHSSHAVVAVLDELYDQGCITQLSGDLPTFRIVASILQIGLNTYLRPMAQWISMGEVNGDQDFFIFERDPDCDPGRLWNDRYAIRKVQNGQTAAPAFLLPFVDRIFALGKGRAFLRAIASYPDDENDRMKAPSLDISAIDIGFLPFSQALAETLESWILDQSRDQTPLLRTAILHHHGLLQLPHNFQHIFFSENGRRFQTFADTLFWRIDHGAEWGNSFLLTELAQSTLGRGEGIAAENLTVGIAGDDETSSSSKTEDDTSVQHLESLNLNYHIPWQLQNVTSSAHLPTNTRAFTLLLQTYRGKYLLRQHALSVRRLDYRRSSLSAGIQTVLRLQQRLSTFVDLFHAHITHNSAVLATELRISLEGAEDIDAMAAIWKKHEGELEMNLLLAERLKPVREAIVGGLLGACEKLMKGFERLCVSQSAETGEENDGRDSELSSLEDDVDKSLSFIGAGLRGIGRAGGNTALEQLAERLEWAVH